MYKPVLKGTYYEMGHKYGALLFKHGKHGFRISEQPDEKLKFGKESEAEVRRVFPEILEEIRGFADACHARYEDVSAFILSIGAFKAEPQMCSVFAASNDSDVIFGRNYDFYYSFKKETESCLACPNDGYWSIGTSDVFIGREDGVNEKGLATAMTGVDSEGNKPGISFILALRCVLDKCANVKEAVKTLSNAHFTSTYNFLLADKTADVAVVEVSTDRVRVRKPEDADNFIVCTNHFVHPEMLEKEDEKARCWDSIPRYNAIYGSLKGFGGNISIKNAQEILSNHSGYVCSHQAKIKLGTLWSVAASLKEPRIFKAVGHPCKAKYVQDMRLNKAIQKR
ncbi:C45 family autoproteolytic acyltransferase/hydrolase [Candidatus Bathyarchaeota archaeon]|nr:C45 family autoproteolytic acyltransferase/hydrolase [Candidatus Bathyarchaeota archaeon]